MFEYDPQLEEDITQPEENYVEEVTPGAGEYDKLDPTQLLHTAITKDMDLKGTLSSVESAEKIKDEEKRMIEAVRQKVIEPKHHKSKTKDTKAMDKEAIELIIEAEDKVKQEHLDLDEAARQVLEKHRSDEESGDEVDAKAEKEERESDKSKLSEEENQTLVECIFSYVRFGWKMCTSALHYLSAFFDRHSREHRYVAFVLDQEKKNLKYSMCDVSY